MTEVWACTACTLHNQPDDSICAACSAARPGFAAEPCDTAPMEAVVKALADVSLQTIGLDDERPKRGTKGFAHLPNGDCMPHALALGTHYLLERRVQSNEEHVSIAAQMRSLLHTHMERRWYGSCMVTEGGLRWHTLVTLAHNSAVSDIERAQYASWGSDPAEQMERWRSERGQFYCGMPELLAFAEMCQEVGGVRIGLRVWRQVAGQLQLMQRVPEPRAGDEQAVVLPHVEMLVFDLQLTGEMDSAAAHYKLLQSGSLRGGEPRKANSKAVPKKRKR